jgi:hypothetical protein
MINPFDTPCEMTGRKSLMPLPGPIIRNAIIPQSAVCGTIGPKVRSTAVRGAAAVSLRPRPIHDCGTVCMYTVYLYKFG